MIKLQYDIGIDSICSDYHVTDVLASFCGLVKPKVIVECGTYLGRTATVIAGALITDVYRDFHVYTAEIDPEAAAEARQLMERNGVHEFITLYVGDAADMLAEIVPAVIDFAYVDGGDRLGLTRSIYDRLTEGGLLVLDDANQFNFKGLKPSLTLRSNRGLAVYQKVTYAEGNDIEFDSNRMDSVHYRNLIAEGRA